MEYTVGTAGIIIKFVSGAGMLIFLLITLLAVENLMQDIDQRAGRRKSERSSSDETAKKEYMHA